MAATSQSAAASSDEKEKAMAASSQSATASSGEGAQKKSRRPARDVFHDVLDARGDLAVGSQLSLTQCEDKAEAAADGGFGALARVLEGARPRDLRLTLREHAGDPQLRNMVQCVFRVSSPGDRVGLNRRLLLYRELFELARTGKHNRRGALLNFLLAEVAHLPAEALAHLVELARQSLGGEDARFGRPEERWSPFEFLPCLLSRVLELPAGEVDPLDRCREDAGDLDGAGFALQTIEEVCLAPWPVTGVVMVVSTLHELSSHLSPDLTVRVVERAMAEMLVVPLEQLPRLANYTLLMLSAAGGDKIDLQVACLGKLIHTVEQLHSRFERDDDVADKLIREPVVDDPAARKALLQAIGGVISSFCMIISKDVALGRAFVKSCARPRGGASKLSVFTLAVLVALARNPRLRKRVLEVCTQRVRDICAASCAARRSRWLGAFHGHTSAAAGKAEDTEEVATMEAAAMGGEDAEADADVDADADATRGGGKAEGLESSAHLEAVFRDLVEHSTIGGWDAVVQSLSSLGMAMLDAHNVYEVSARAVCNDVRVPAPQEQDEAESSERQEAVHAWREIEARDAGETVAALGLEVLARSFAKHSIVQRDILEQVRVRVLGAAGSSHKDLRTKQVVRLIARLVDEAPNLLLKEVNTVKDILVGLPKLAPRVSHGVLQALSPLLELRVDLVDFAVVVFRKALFQRDVQPRLVALHGFLFVLRTMGATGRAEAQLDLLHCVHRCLSHQKEVRAALYAGLGDLYLGAARDATARAAILDLLLTHLNSLLLSPMELAEEDAEDAECAAQDDDTVAEPLQNLEQFPVMIMERCMERSHGSFVDPVHLLIRQLVRIASSSTADAAEVRPVRRVLRELRRRVRTCSAEETLEAMSGPGAALLASFVCEELQTAGFSASIWDKQCALMQRYADLAAGAGLPGAPRKGKKKRRRADADAEGDEDRSTTTTEAAALGRALAGVPSGLGVAQLCTLAEDTTLHAAAREHVLAVLCKRLPGLRALGRGGSGGGGGGGEGDDTSLAMSVQIARLAGAGHGDDSLQLLQRVGAWLSEMLLESSGVGELEAPLECFVAFRECAQIAAEMGALGLWLDKSLVSQLEDDSGTPVDRALSALLGTICGGLLAVGKPNWNKVQTVSEAVTVLLPLSEAARRHARWIRHELMAREWLMSPRCADTVVQMHLTAESLVRDCKHLLVGAYRLAAYIRTHTCAPAMEDEAMKEEGENRSQNGDAKNSSKNKFALVNSSKLAATVVLAIVSHLAQGMSECESVAAQIRDDPVLLTTVDERLEFHLPALKSAVKRRNAQERLLFSRLTDIAVVSQELLACDLPSSKCAEHLLKLNLRHYKLLGAQLKSHAGAKRRTVSPHLCKLLERTRTHTDALYELLRRDDTTWSVAKLAKEARFVPNLIFQVEQYDVYLIKLSKVLADRDNALLDYVAPSLNRDFRIRSSSSKSKRLKK